MLDEAPDDVEEVLVSGLSSVHRAAITRRSGDPYPFILIRHVDGKENVDEGTADHLVEIKTLCQKSLGEVAARDHCRNTHRRMLEIARDLPDIPLSNGRMATVDYVTVFRSPRWIEIRDDDQVLAKAGWYTVGLSYAPIED